MKSSKADVHSRVHAIPEIRFEDGQKMTPYAGMVLIQALFEKLRLKERLQFCFGNRNSQAIFGKPVAVILLVTHLLLGFRKLRGLDYYREDPLITRIIGVRQLPDVSTETRTLGQIDVKEVLAYRSLIRGLVLDRLLVLDPARVTLDFDGSVQSTKRHAEGTAVGYNKIKKGARSYYPLFCTVSQSGQILDLYHRSGNVHDSRGAMLFMRACILAVKRKLPHAQIEVRIDGAFFSERLLRQLDRMGVLFSASVPFERLAELKRMIEERRHWEVIDESWSCFEAKWKPKSWSEEFRFVVSRQRVKKQDKDPIQLDLFAPKTNDVEEDYEYDYRVMVTNQGASGRTVIGFHHGRGSQERIFSEAKSMASLDYIPFNRLIPNQIYALSAVLAHNLTRELQMQAETPERGTTRKRSPLWNFQTLSTMRQNLFHRAGIFKRPQGKLTLVLNSNPVVERELRYYLAALTDAA